VAETMLDTILNNADSMAKFAAIILSAVLAFIGILLSQWRTRLREDRANRRSKCEEMVVDLSTIYLERLLLITHVNNKYCQTPDELLTTHSGKTKEHFNKISSLSIKVDMLLDLYAPEIRKDESIKLTSLKGYLLSKKNPAVDESSNEYPYPKSILQWSAGADTLLRVRKDIVSYAKGLT
jgi:hypothetical protein